MLWGATGWWDPGSVHCCDLEQLEVEQVGAGDYTAAMGTALVLLL